MKKIKSDYPNVSMYCEICSKFTGCEKSRKMVCESFDPTVKIKSKYSK